MNFTLNTSVIVMREKNLNKNKFIRYPTLHYCGGPIKQNTK